MTELRKLTIGDGPNLDAFSRLRVSNPAALADAQLTYSLQPLILEQYVSGTNTTITHDVTNRCATMTFTAATNGAAWMQTYEHYRYNPARSHLAFATFCMDGGVAGATKFVGLSDGSNGVEFTLLGTTPAFRIRSTTSNGNQTVTQTNWNLDTMDGNGPSGINLDWTKTNILICDLEALYVGRVRCGFVVGGNIIYAHEFNHANSATSPYIASANLPIRAGMTSTGGVTTTMEFICFSVNSEGGNTSATGYDFSATATPTAASGTRTHALSIRPRTTFNGITNRATLQFAEVELLVTGNNPVEYELCLGQALTSAAYTNVNVTYSTVEVDTAGTLTGSPAIVIDRGWVPASASTKAVSSAALPFRYPITLDAAGAVRTNGTLTLVVTGIGGSSACRVALNWREIR